MLKLLLAWIIIFLLKFRKLFVSICLKISVKHKRLF